MLTQVNATNSGGVRVWERKLRGFRLNRAMQIEAAFFFNDTATPKIYTLSLRDALPICATLAPGGAAASTTFTMTSSVDGPATITRSEEHTSELQSPCNLVCRLLLE